MQSNWILEGLFMIRFYNHTRNCLACYLKLSLQIQISLYCTISKPCSKYSYGKWKITQFIFIIELTHDGLQCGTFAKSLSTKHYYHHHVVENTFSTKLWSVIFRFIKQQHLINVTFESMWVVFGKYMDEEKVASAGLLK